MSTSSVRRGFRRGTDGIWIVDDRAIAPIVVTLMLIGLTVSVAAIPAVMLTKRPDVPDAAIAGLDVVVDPGEAGWGDGDEWISVRHQAGEPVRAGDVEVQIRSAQGRVVVPGQHHTADENSKFASKVAPWEHPMFISALDTLYVEVVWQRVTGEIVLLSTDILVPEETWWGEAEADGSEIDGTGDPTAPGLGGDSEPYTETVDEEFDDGNETFWNQTGNETGNQTGGNETGEPPAPESEADPDADDNGPKTEICHHPPGNPDNFHTLKVGKGAVDAHLAHGDTLGACDAPEHDHDHGAEPEATPPLVDAFTIAADGGILMGCDAVATLKVLGTQITYGKNGPDIPVRVHASSSGTAPYQALFGDSAVDGGETFGFGTLTAGSKIGIKAFADYKNIHYAYASFQSDPHIVFLRDGDAAPDKPAFGNQQSLTAYLQPYVHTGSKTMDLGLNQVIILVEFNPNLNSSAADFQDLVVLVEFDKATCYGS